MTPPCRPFRALPRPHPLHPVSPHLPSFSLSAYTCLFECRWHKKTFIATKYICFSILSVAPSRRHLWHALLYWTVPQLCRLTSNPLLQPSLASAWIWLASIFTLCFFFPTHTSLHSASTCQRVRAEGRGGSAPSSGSSSLRGVPCSCSCLLSLSVLRLRLPNQPVLSAVRACSSCACVVSVLKPKLLKPHLAPPPPFNPTRVPREGQ